MTNHPDQIDREMQEALNELIDSQPEPTDREMEQQYQKYLLVRTQTQTSFIDTLDAIGRIYQHVRGA